MQKMSLLAATEKYTDLGKYFVFISEFFGSLNIDF